MNNYGKLYEENCHLRSEQAKLVKQIDQLTNNWNELEEHLNHEIEEWQDVSDDWTKAQVQEDKIILDKMKEIKGRKDVSNNN